jgi:hypothetical protein
MHCALVGIHACWTTNMKPAEQIEAKRSADARPDAQ